MLFSILFNGLKLKIKKINRLLQKLKIKMSSINQQNKFNYAIQNQSGRPNQQNGYFRAEVKEWRCVLETNKLPWCRAIVSEKVSTLPKQAANYAYRHIWVILQCMHQTEFFRKNGSYLR